MMNPMIQTMLAVLVLGAALVSQPAFAVPSSLPVQGYLSALGEGEAMPETLEMTFQLKQSVGGFGPLYEETMEVELTDGFFSVMLGKTQPLDSALFEQDLKMVLVIEGEPLEFELGSVPYAHRAATSERAEEADHAAQADQAAKATQAQLAEDALRLGGEDASAYVKRGNCTTVLLDAYHPAGTTQTHWAKCPAGTTAVSGASAPQHPVHHHYGFPFDTGADVGWGCHVDNSTGARDAQVHCHAVCCKL